MSNKNKIIFFFITFYLFGFIFFSLKYIYFLTFYLDRRRQELEDLRRYIARLETTNARNEERWLQRQQEFIHNYNRALDRLRQPAVAPAAVPPAPAIIEVPDAAPPAPAADVIVPAAVPAPAVIDAIDPNILVPRIPARNLVILATKFNNRSEATSIRSISPSAPSSLNDDRRRRNRDFDDDDGTIFIVFPYALVYTLVIVYEYII